MVGNLIPAATSLLQAPRSTFQVFDATIQSLHLDPDPGSFALILLASLACASHRHPPPARHSETPSESHAPASPRHVHLERMVPGVPPDSTAGSPGSPGFGGFELQVGGTGGPESQSLFPS